MPKDALEFQQMASDFVNAFNPESERFIRYMSADHRTIQQAFTKLCFQWLEHVASEGYRTDGRNIASHQIAKQMLDEWYSKERGGERDPQLLPSRLIPMV